MSGHEEGLWDYEQYGKDRLQLRPVTLQKRTAELTIFLDFLSSRKARTLDQIQALDLSEFLSSRGHLKPRVGFQIAVIKTGCFFHDVLTWCERIQIMMSLFKGGFFIFHGGKGWGEKGKVWTTPFSPRRGLAPPIRQTRFLILFVEVCVKTLLEVGREYPWQRPERCPKCQGLRVWGHGYVSAYFDEAGSQSVFLKRYRCGECGVVIRMRPSGYWRRIQATVAAVRQWVLHRLEKGRWPPGSNAARGRHWLRGLGRQVRTHLGMSYAGRIAEGFLELVSRGVCAVSRAV